MAISIRTATRNAGLDTIATAAGNAALLRIYDGSAPASANAALSGNTLLAELTCGTPFAGAASSGALTANSITQDSSANATGTASFFRIYDSGGTNCIFQGTVGTSGADLNLNTVSIVSGGPVAVTSLVLTAGNA
jgi:hypothetical protein